MYLANVGVTFTDFDPASARFRSGSFKIRAILAFGFSTSDGDCKIHVAYILILMYLDTYKYSTRRILEHKIRHWPLLFAYILRRCNRCRFCHRYHHKDHWEICKIHASTHWGKNPQFIHEFTFWNYYFSQNSHFQSIIFLKIHNFKVSFLTKFTFSKSHFSQNSHFQSLIFLNSHFLNIKFLVISG